MAERVSPFDTIHASERNNVAIRVDAIILDQFRHNAPFVDQFRRRAASLGNGEDAVQATLDEVRSRLVADKTVPHLSLPIATDEAGKKYKIDPMNFRTAQKDILTYAIVQDMAREPRAENSHFMNAVESRSHYYIEDLGKFDAVPPTHYANVNMMTMALQAENSHGKGTLPHKTPPAHSGIGHQRS